MNFNFGAFWSQLGVVADKNPFDKHFDDPELKLQTLLDDDLIIGEFKTQNQQLMNLQSHIFQNLFLSITFEHMRELVSYVVVEPENDQNSKRAFRYPFYACELLCCEISKVTDSFFPKDQEESDFTLFKDLLQIVEQAQAEVNPVLAGYFSKVFQNIYKLKQDEVLNYIFSDKGENFIQKLINQISSKSLSDVMIKILCIEKESKNDTFINQRKDILYNLIKQLNRTENFEIPGNIAIIIHELIVKAYAIQKSDILLQELLGTQLSQFIIEQSYHENHYISAAASSIVHALLHLVYQDQIKLEDDEANALKLDFSDCLQQFHDHLPQILDYLRKDTPLLGSTKFKLIESIQMAIKLPSTKISIKLAEQNLFEVLNNLVRKFDQNNLLHSLYHRIIVNLVESQDKVYEPLIVNIFETNNVVEFMLHCVFELDNDNGKRKGYLGFFTKLSQFLEKVGEKNQYYQKFLEKESWNLFKEKFYIKAKQQCEQELGGYTKDTRIDHHQDNSFSKEEIQQKYSDFLQNDSAFAQKDSSESSMSNPFDAFSQQSFEQSTTPLDQLFDGFEQQTSQTQFVQFDATSQNAWDQQFQQEDQNTKQESHTNQFFEAEKQSESDYWKIQHTKDIEQRAMEEFDANF